MGRNKNSSGGSKGSTATVVQDTEKAALSEDAKAVAKELADWSDMSADEAYKQSRNFAKALGISFLGHPPHGSNFSKRRSGVQVMQNVLDGMTKSAKKTLIIDGIFNETGVQLY